MPSLRSSSGRGELNPKTRCLTPLLVFVIFILAAFYLLVAFVGTHHVHHHDLPTASAAGRTEETDTLTRRVVALEKRVIATENELYMTKAALSVKSGSASGMHGIFSNVADSPHAFKTTPHNTKTTPIVNLSSRSMSPPPPPLPESSIPARAQTLFSQSPAITSKMFVDRGKGKCGPDGMVAVTYASHGGRDDRFCRAVESAIRNQVPWEVLGWGIKWEGLSQKLQASLDYVRGLDPNCILLFSDAFDILFAEGLSAIKAKFEKTGAKLLFAGECGCWPQVVQDQQRGYKKKGHICNDLYPASPTPYKFLNSGAWMGYAKAAEGLLAAVVKRANSQYGMKTNDQEMVSDMYIERQFNISLDWHAMIFQCMHSTRDAPLPHCNPMEHLRESKGIWKNTLTGTMPALFHFK